MDTVDRLLEPIIKTPMAQIGFQALINIKPSFFYFGTTQGRIIKAGKNQRQNERPIGAVFS